MVEAAPYPQFNSIQFNLAISKLLCCLRTQVYGMEWVHELNLGRRFCLRAWTITHQHFRRAANFLLQMVQQE